MKYKVKHPILVPAIPKGHRTKHLVASSIETVFDLPQQRLLVDAIPALSYRTPKAARDKGAPERTEIFATEGGFYTPAVAKDGIVSALNSVSISPMIANAAVAIIRREANAAAKREQVPKVVFARENAAPVAKEDKLSDKEMLRLPSIDKLADAAIDHAALRDNVESIRREIAAEFILVDRMICQRVAEPYYAVVNGSTHGCSLTICSDDIPSGTVAIFRLGHLDEARSFMQRFAVGPSYPDMTEGPGAHSELDDAALSVANAACVSLRAFKSHYHHEYQSKSVIDKLMLETPLEHIAAARKLDNITSARTVFGLVQEAERLVPVLEEIASFGAKSQFIRSDWRDAKQSPLELIVDLWNNQSIDIDIAPIASARGPR
ncbi:hypothetical protein [Rhizobium sp. BK176]|uniref:hypothetical protein n=1 Tax=Rhizobium sp. BK176 TaxID=2587071 RepID=UPI0021671AF8|nr:hypothetical protein [Rhizobium sp. BK176]MCS4088881.1 hypothetical protein [Rhizobium sp. BK176]